MFCWSCSVLPVGPRLGERQNDGTFLGETVWLDYWTMAKDTSWTSGGGKPVFCLSHRRALSPGAPRLEQRLGFWCGHSVMLQGRALIREYAHTRPSCALAPKPVTSVLLPGVMQKLGLYSRVKGLGRIQAHPCDSSQAGGEGAPTVQKPAPNQAGLPYAMLGHFCFGLGFFWWWGKVDFGKQTHRWESWVELLCGLNYLWRWGWRPSSSPKHFLLIKWGSLAGSCETSCPVIHETRNLTQFRLQLALVSRTPGGGWQNWLKYWENVSLSEIIKSGKNFNQACKH